jgi:DNA primase catalytic subunit
MLFLVQYDRRAGRIVSLKSYANDQRLMARKARLDLEIELHRHSQNHEVVLLEAASEEALRKTHGRYFEDVEHLLAVAIGV